VWRQEDETGKRPAAHHKERLDKARIDESEILEAARQYQGLERLDQIKYAILERGGGISIVPVQQG